MKVIIAIVLLVFIIAGFIFFTTERTASLLSSPHILELL